MLFDAGLWLVGSTRLATDEMMLFRGWWRYSLFIGLMAPVDRMAVLVQRTVKDDWLIGLLLLNSTDSTE